MLRLAGRILRWVGVAFGALILMVLGLLGFLQTTPGKAVLASVASHLASGRGLTVEISGIGGRVPTSVTIDHIRLKDADGTFGEIDNVALAWSPLRLFAGELAIESLEVGRAFLSRRPELPPSEGGGGFPVFPVAIDRLAVADIDLREPFLARAARLSLTGSARIVNPAEGLELTFALLRKDRPGEATGEINFSPEGNTLTMDIMAREPAGGMLMRMAGLSDLPAVSGQIVGSGTLDDWSGTLSLAAGDKVGLSGNATIRRVETGHRLMVDLTGTVAPLIPQAWQPIFADRSEVIGSAVMDDGGVLTIEGLNLRSAGLGFALIGKIDTAAATGDIAFDLVGGDPARFGVLLPGIGWNNLRINAKVSGALRAPKVDATLTGASISGSGYTARQATITATTRPSLDGSLALDTAGSLSGLLADDAKIAKILGDRAQFHVTGTLSPSREFAVSGAFLSLAPIDLRYEGQVAKDGVAGILKLEIADLTALAPFAGRPLAGSLRLAADVNATANLSEISIKFDGVARRVVTGIGQLDGFLDGQTTVDGGISRHTDGSLVVNDLKLSADGLNLAVNGRIDDAVADLTANLAVAESSRLDPRLTGPFSFKAAFSGTRANLAVDATLAMPNGTAIDRPIRDLALSVVASDILGSPSGVLALTGSIAGRQVTGSGRLISMEGDGRRLEGLNIGIGSVIANGDLALNEGFLNGKLSVDAANLADISPLLLEEVSGRLTALVTFGSPDRKQRVTVAAKGDGISMLDRSIASLDATATIDNLGSAFSLDGIANVSGLRSGNLTVERAKVVATSGASKTTFDVEATLLGGTLAGTGEISTDKTMAVRLDTLRLARGGTVGTLTTPATLTFADGGMAIDRLVVAAGGGSAVVSGKTGATLELNAELRSLPLSLVTLVSPGFAATGTVSGTAGIRGTAAAPTGSYDVTVSGLNTQEMSRAGAGPFDVHARGSLDSRRVGIEMTMSGPSLRGCIVSGLLSTDAGNLDLRVRGEVGLGLANTFLASSGSRISGSANVNMTIAGTVSSPTVAGRATIAGGRFDDPVNGLTLTNIQGALEGSDRSLTIASLSGRTPNGGTVSARGNVAVDLTGGFPTNIEITLNNAALVSNGLMRFVAGGNLSISGSMTQGLRVGGRVTVRSLDINLAERLGGGLPEIDVKHVNAAGGMALPRTDAKATAARIAERRANSDSGVFVAALDLRVSAPNGVFVRGMGVDAELGGDIVLTGTTAAPTALGGFQLRRGRFNIVGRQLNFSSGEIAFEGSTDPVLNLVAETSGGDVAARMTMTGRASAPVVTLTSTPSLPQDEIMARLLFGRSLGTLTVGQTLQVAQTIAQFSGGGPGILDRVRRSLGVDSFDVGTEGVGIGKRLNDRVYLGVRQGATPDSSKVTVDVDITRNIRVQGAAGADGSNELGVGAQWDY